MDVDHTRAITTYRFWIINYSKHISSGKMNSLSNSSLYIKHRYLSTYIHVAGDGPPFDRGSRRALPCTVLHPGEVSIGCKHGDPALSCLYQVGYWLTCSPRSVLKRQTALTQYYVYLPKISRHLSRLLYYPPTDTYLSNFQRPTTSNPIFPRPPTDDGKAPSLASHRTIGYSQDSS